MPNTAASSHAYEPVIGLEVHVELKTASKMFCGCANNPFHAQKPNIHTCPVCLGMPGGLPVPNKKAIEWTLMAGMALNCRINSLSKFDRKHYFYPDLSKGYQISQFDTPFGSNGSLAVEDGTVRIRRIHLEEDTGKLLHTVVNGQKVSLIDFNRSGVPLIEIVTEPDIASGAQAKAYGKKLRQLLRFLDIADCDMERGGMRLEANVSLRKKGQKGLPPYKVEVKNINSFRFLEQAIQFELKRQAELLDSGATPTQETRGWDAHKNATVAQRNKEEAEDYRYFPDPDIPPLRLKQTTIDRLRKALPELPDAMAKRWQKTYHLTSAQTQQLLQVEDFRQLEETLALAAEKQLNPKLLANDWINRKLVVGADMQPAAILAAFEKLHATQVIEADQLQQIITTVLAAHSDAVEKYQRGEQQVIGFLMGQVLRAIPQKPDPQVVREALMKALASYV